MLLSSFKWLGNPLQATLAWRSGSSIYPGLAVPGSIKILRYFVGEIATCIIVVCACLGSGSLSFCECRRAFPPRRTRLPWNFQQALTASVEVVIASMVLMETFSFDRCRHICHSFRFKSAFRHSIGLVWFRAAGYMVSSIPLTIGRRLVIGMAPLWVGLCNTWAQGANSWRLTWKRWKLQWKLVGTSTE